jgi:hypothetical protein
MDDRAAGIRYIQNDKSWAYPCVRKARLDSHCLHGSAELASPLEDWAQLRP